MNTPAPPWQPYSANTIRLNPDRSGSKSGALPSYDPGGGHSPAGRISAPAHLRHSGFPSLRSSGFEASGRTKRRRGGRTARGSYGRFAVIPAIRASVTTARRNAGTAGRRRCRFPAARRAVVAVLRLRGATTSETWSRGRHAGAPYGHFAVTSAIRVTATKAGRNTGTAALRCCGPTSARR